MKLKIRNRKYPAYPLIALAAASFLLLIILGIITYLNFNHDKKLLRKQLQQEGLTIIRSTEAGARTGMMQMYWGENQIQTLIRETAKGPNIVSIVLADKNGNIIASSNSKPGNRGAINFEKPKSKTEFISEIIIDRNGDEVFRIIKQFEPINNKKNSMMNGSMSGMMQRMMGSPKNKPSVIKPQFIILNLNMEEYKTAQADDIRRAVISGIILLVLGSASFYFLFILQGYYVTDNALKNMETYTQNVVESMPNGLFSLNKKGRIESVNHYAAELLKLNHSALHGKLLSEILSKSNFEEILSNEKTIIEEQINCRLNDGSVVPLSITASRIYNQNGEDIGSVIIFRDLREIRSLEQQVERSERLASLGRMAAGIAHEIRNPLSSIKGFAQYFKNKFQSNSEEWHYAGVMVNEVNRLNRVIKDLLNFAKPHEPNFEKCNLPQIINHSLKLIEPEIKEKKISVIKNIDNNQPELYADNDLITQTLLNLFLNAADALDTNGKLEIKTAFQNGNVNIEITDNGEGIAQENLAHIFDPFFTSKKDGTGLGLAIVYRIIENHNGRIDVESEPGNGTTFKILLPSKETI